MTPDTRDYESRKYLAPRFNIVPLQSGRFALTSGYNPFPLIATFETAEEALAEGLKMPPAKAAQPPRPAFDLKLDLSLMRLPNA
jgi:hypothetical protein